METKALISEYISEISEFQEQIQDFLENDENNESDFQDIVNYIKIHGYQENKLKLKELLCLIAQITYNFHHTPHFYDKIEQILRIFSDNIKQFFTKSDIINIFGNNKRILLYFFREHILIPDLTICSFISSKRDSFYPEYFYPEFKSFYDDLTKSKIDDKIIEFSEKNFDEFDAKRTIGENDSYICELIRNDDAAEFVTYISQTNISPNSQISSSIFETNRFLAKKKPTLIEYASFFGSIQIFKYLQINEAEMTESLGLFAIHGNNAEMIHILESICISTHVNECLKEAIKCHHNNMAIYIKNNLFDKKLFLDDLKYFNFSYLVFDVDDLTNIRNMEYFALYDYPYIVNCLFENLELDDNNREKIIIFKLFFF